MVVSFGEPVCLGFISESYGHLPQGGQGVSERMDLRTDSMKEVPFGKRMGSLSIQEGSPDFAR